MGNEERQGRENHQKKERTDENEISAAVERINEMTQKKKKKKNERKRLSWSSLLSTSTVECGQIQMGVGFQFGTMQMIFSCGTDESGYGE